MIENTSLIIGFVNEDGKVVAFARVLTDFVFHALVYDCIGAEPLRGQGLGRELMDAVAEHPRLKRVSAVWLCCLPEMVPFYENWGFAVCDESLKWMVKLQREGWARPKPQVSDNKTEAG